MEFKNITHERSLYVTLGVIIVLVVTIIMSIHTAYVYMDTKNNIFQGMKQSSRHIIVSLQKNVMDLMKSYSINEYDKLVLNEMEGRDNFAIIVEDYNMGKILGEKAFLSGKIRDAEGNIIDYDSKNSEQNKQLEACYYSDKYDITTDSGDKLGTIAIYISNISMNAQLNKIIIGSIINLVLLSLLFLLSLFIIIHFFILKPLSDIISCIKHSDHDGIPVALIPNHGSKEIFLLSNTMNNMIISIRDSRVALKAQKNALHYQANHDALTGLANRILFNDRLEQSIIKAKNNSTKVALFFIDLDHFKKINDSLGHEIGDKILKVVTQRLNETICKEATLARLGGDEFSIIVEDLRQGQDASLLANKLIELLSQPLTIEDNLLYISSSIGISIYPDDGVSAQNLIKYADAAMYKAKDEGRNNFQYYSAEMTELAFERVVMDTSLREALKNGDFVVYYQPQVNGNNNKLVGMEALVRWQHPIMGLVAPSKFIPLAEETGMIIPLDQYVMRCAMTQIAKWYKEGFKPGVVALNLAMKQLHQKDFISILETMLKETECKAEWIELEVTESQIMTNPEEAIKILKQINDMGIKLAVDDFGTGYSSLSYLKRLPIDKLKIDQSFIRDLPEDEEDASITKAVIALSKSLNLRVIAEGVETKEQKEFLIENGCNNIQGYFYGKPMPANEMEKVLSKGFNS
ncbi:MAG: EAL domain-containing protein [Campylobacterales bacterium]|nr:EAL domain-containing protein [Campylobacterales bacterium]